MAKTNQDKLFRWLDKAFPTWERRATKSGWQLFPPASLPVPSTKVSGFVLVHNGSSDKRAIQRIRQDFRKEWGVDVPVSAWA